MFDYITKRFPKPERKIRLQILVFLKWRRHKGMSDADYERILDDFLNFTHKDDVLDVTAVDVLSFIEYVRENNGGSEFRVRRAEVVLRQFKRFYAARGKMMKDIKDYTDMLLQEGVGFVADIKRNKDIVRLRLQDPKKWTYRALGEEFGIHYTRVKQIFERDVRRYYSAR